MDNKNILKKILISIILGPIIWFIGSNTFFNALNTSFLYQSRILEEISWDFERSYYENITYLHININTEIWINNPLPIFTAPAGECFISAKEQAFIENTTYIEAIGCTSHSMGPNLHIFNPGTQIYSEIVTFELYTNENLTQIPKGQYILYTKLIGWDPDMISYKLYLNITDGENIIYSDEIPDYWGEYISSSLIFIGFIVGFLLILIILPKLRLALQERNITSNKSK